MQLRSIRLRFLIAQYLRLRKNKATILRHVVLVRAALRPECDFRIEVMKSTPPLFASCISAREAGTVMHAPTARPGHERRDFGRLSPCARRVHRIRHRQIGGGSHRPGWKSALRIVVLPEIPSLGLEPHARVVARRRIRSGACPVGSSAEHGAALACRSWRDGRDGERAFGLIPGRDATLTARCPPIR